MGPIWITIAFICGFAAVSRSMQRHSLKREKFVLMPRAKAINAC